MSNLKSRNPEGDSSPVGSYLFGRETDVGSEHRSSCGAAGRSPLNSR